MALATPLHSTGQTQFFIAPQFNLALGKNTLNSVGDSLNAVSSPFFLQPGYGISIGARSGRVMVRAGVQRYGQLAKVRITASLDFAGGGSVASMVTRFLTPNSLGLNVSVDVCKTHPHIYAGLGGMVNHYTFTPFALQGTGGVFSDIVFDSYMFSAIPEQRSFAGQFFVGYDFSFSHHFKAFGELGYNHSPDYNWTTTARYKINGKVGGAFAQSAFRHPYSSFGMAYFPFGIKS